MPTDPKTDLPASPAVEEKKAGLCVWHRGALVVACPSWKQLTGKVRACEEYVAYADLPAPVPTSPAKEKVDLSSCPFCGSTNVRLVHNPAGDSGWDLHYVECDSCDCEGPSEQSAGWKGQDRLDKGAAEAVRLWNQRTI